MFHLTAFPTSPLRAAALAAALLTAGGLALAQHTGHAAPAVTPARTTAAKLPLTVLSATIVAVPPGITETSAHLTLKNAGSTAVVLTGASSATFGHVMLMKTTRTGAMTGMKTVPTLTVPARGTLTMGPGGDHLMLMGIKRPLKPGEKITLTLKAKDGRTLNVAATVRKP